MGLSRDQKRKAKLKKREQRSHRPESLAYSGSKYRDARLTPVVYATELGIYEVYRMSGRTLTDRTVEAALVHLVTRMRQGSLPPLPQERKIIATEEDWGELVIDAIRREWRRREEAEGLASRDDVIGVVRTILNSIEVWRSKSMNAQGYLQFLEGFMKKLGVSVDLVSETGEPEVGESSDEESEDPLLALGREWVWTQDKRTEIAFADLVDSTIRSGAPERVIEVCQKLEEESTDLSILPRLEKFAILGCLAQEEQRKHARDGGAAPSSPPGPRAS